MRSLIEDGTLRYPPLIQFVGAFIRQALKCSIDDFIVPLRTSSIAHDIQTAVRFLGHDAEFLHQVLQYTDVEFFAAGPFLVADGGFDFDSAQHLVKVNNRKKVAALKQALSDARQLPSPPA